MSRKTAEVVLSAIVFVFLLLLEPLPVHAAASTLIQQNSDGCRLSGCTGTLAVSFLSDVASGNVIVVGVVIYGGTVNSVSDSKGSTLTQAVSATFGSSSVYIYVATLSSSGSDTVTVSFSPAGEEEDVYIYEVSGVTTTGAGTGTGSGTGTLMSTSAVAFLSGAFLLGVMITPSPRSVTAGAGFTLSPAPSLTYLSYAEYATSGVSSPTTFPATVSSLSAWVEVGVALNPTAAPVGGFVESINKLGLLVPWLAVIGLVGCIGAVVVVARKRQSEREESQPT